MTDVETPRVSLTVISAANVGEMRMEGSSTVGLYCQAQCGEVVLRTAAKANTTSPEWMQNFTFGVKKPLGNTVAFKVYGLNERGGDVFFGGVSLPIDTLVSDAQSTHKMTLVDAAGKSCGELTVSARYEPKFVAPPQQVTKETPKLKLASPLKVAAPFSPERNSILPASKEEKSVAGNVSANHLIDLAASNTLKSTESSNLYVVTILEAMDLPACDGSGIEATSDPYVRINCTKNSSQRTKTQQQTLHPSWRQQFYFKIVPGEKQQLELIVEDSNLLTSDFMGRCVIDLDEYKKQYQGTKQTFWLALEQQLESKDKNDSSDMSSDCKMNNQNGKLCLAIDMQYIAQDICSLAQGEIDNITKVPSGHSVSHLGYSVGVDEGKDNIGSHGDEANHGDEDEDNVEVKKKEAVSQRKQREEERQKMLMELSNVHFLSGDYQVRVHIIEVRDLQPMDANGLCDPVVSVECLGQRQSTVVKQKQLSCVFDEYLYFDFKELDKDRAQQGNIEISVFDADGPGSSANRMAAFRSSDDIIGVFGVDIPYVYFQPDHEMKRKWVALVGSGATNSDTIQGYVLLSLVVLGPGDQSKLYDSAEDNDPNELLVKTKADINSMVLVPPRVTQEHYYLVVTVYRAEELPDMDYSLVMHGGIDGYVRAYFSGQDVLETKKVTTKGSNDLAVLFNQELWFPVLLPTMSDNIFISVWDWDMTADQLVANIVQPFSFKQVHRYPNQFKHIWANLYGPPVGYDTKSIPLQQMQNYPTHASSYRGRLLLSLRVEKNLQSINDEAHVKNILNVVVSPKMKRYTLRAALFYGTEIPVFTSKTSWNRNTRMSLKISVGRHVVESSRVQNVSGICHFNQYIDIINAELPADLDQIPDIFVHLVRKTMNEARCICFARFKAQDFFSEELKSIKPPQWVVLQKDKVVDELKDHNFTGNVLMNLRIDDAEQNGYREEEIAQQWRQHASTTVPYTKYVLFVHIFQGRCLPSTDYDGLLDPYVKVACVGSEGQVSTRMSTRDPSFYETVVLDIELPQNEQFLPKVSLQVYDWDRYDADDYIGGINFSLTDFPRMSSTEYTKIRANGEYSAPRPKWYPLSCIKVGDTQGELLLSFDLIKKDTPGVILEPPESIRPPAEKAFIEIMCLGCRGLQPIGFMPINTPFAKFEVGEITKTNQPKFTNPSSKPGSRNPNFLQRIVIPVEMPLDSLFAPRLNITLYDQLLGGFYKPVIGVCSVDLNKKMTFSNGISNPLHIDECSNSSSRGNNPYVDYGDDLSTFPGTVPAAVLKAKSFSNLTDNKSIQVGATEYCSSNSFGYQDDEEDELPHYMQQRETVSGELENMLKSPFETFALFRAARASRDEQGFCERTAGTYRSIGKFKGTVRILKFRDDPPLFDLKQFLNPQPYLIRVYVLDALNLHPTDANNKSDPYLRVSLGDGQHHEQIYNDRDNYQSETLTPKFHKMYEFKTFLPGASELKLEVLDYDTFAIPTLPNGLIRALSSAIQNIVGGDDFVGATTIDLEDRWFNAKWQELGLSPGSSERRKPVEVRSLFAPSSTRPQGCLRLWVDILTRAEMNVMRPLNISLPPPHMFEVRVIVYRAKNVAPGDFTDLSDLFVKCWLQNRDDISQTTDTHWRAKYGRASFNWRMKFNIELPINPEKESDRGHLHFQMWDRDAIYDDCLADAVVDLTSFLKLASKTRQVVNVFAKPKPIRIRGLNDIRRGESSHRPEYSATEDARYAARARSPSPHPGEVVLSIEEFESDKKPLLSTKEVSNYDEAEAASKYADAEMENAQSLVKSFMHRLGMGDDPEDASWLTMTTRDSRTGERAHAGELLVSVEIIPKHQADVRAAGLGRGEPNNFPFLPEPADRLHLSAMWNPCNVLKALMGPKYFQSFASFFLCSVFVLLVLMIGPLINVLLTLFELVPNPFGLICFFFSLGLLMGIPVYLLYRCRRAILRVADSTSKSCNHKTKAHRALR
ncbi:hypothetical protein CCR75_006460 [Bremia lactucae]|uniref:C2 domain-containing protein n=1 Tax=Bremia lactucae TaxID=4779 RepID=A0A976IFE0_BRELC|nr:hypothetical protein CCR75_006460 [Bremia lactucae]